MPVPQYKGNHIANRQPAGETIKLIGRNSRLSLLQIDIVKNTIQSAFPGIKVEVIARSSRGDALQEISLHTVEGSDFFTQDIFDALANGEADIAVHSLKDMSSKHFFGENKFAVVDRDDTRDVAIFNNDIEEKLQSGKTIVIGTCSPRREEMATVFLKKALPQLHAEIKIETKPIRGNVETRLRKLNNEEYDATILATAGINRLLRSEEDASLIKVLLADKKYMLLPLIECVPAPCQGAIVAEAYHKNVKAVEVLKNINDEQLFADCYHEKMEAVKYGTGCIQKFGVTTLHTKNKNYLYAAGKDAEGTEFVKWNPLPDTTINDGSLFSSTDVMKDFFEYEWKDDEIEIDEPVVFVANYKVLVKCPIEPACRQAGYKVLNGVPKYRDRLSPQKFNSSNQVRKQKIILTSGTKTWFELSKQGYWVTASADAMGFEFLLPSLKMPLLNIGANDICILTHDAAAIRWNQKGYTVMSNYKLIPKYNIEIEKRISLCESVFWSSYSQFEFYRKYVKPDAKHLCAGGETAELLKQSGIEPVIFPTIKAFEQWRKYFIRSHSGA